MKTKYSILLILAAFSFAPLFFSCEKTINIKLPAYQQKIVVEGWIDLNDYPVVMLTKNSSYFGGVDSTELAQMIIQDATVTVNNGTTTDTLKKTIDLNYFPPLLYKGSRIKGEIGKTYYLTVKIEGTTLTAMTTILPPVPLDSAWFKVEPGKDSLGYVWGAFTDPPEPGNYYRLYTKRLSKDKIFIPIFGSVYSDKFFNGQTFTFSMMRGEASYTSTVNDPEFGYYKIGDSIVVKACSIDKATYDFWETAESDILNEGDPFVNPSQVVTNIQGGGLGIWAGYGCTFDTAKAR